MSQAELELVRPDHPWLAEFGDDPEGQFDRIVRGVALIPPYGRADALAVIPSLFEPLAPGDSLLSLLDRAAKTWIERWRRMPPGERVEYGFKRYVRDAMTALRLAQLVELSETRAMLREHYFSYLRWVEPLVLNTASDPRAAFWLAIADEQPDLRFESLWQRLCRQTGEDLYPAHYLDIGLLGLRRLPVEEQDRLQRVLAGLATWAAPLPDQAKAKREFLQQVRMLRWLFTLPSRADWWERAEPIIQAYRNRPFAAWWSEELGGRKGPRAKAPVVSEPDVQEALELVRQLRTGKIDANRTKIEKIVSVREHYAEATGYSYFLVRTASNIAGVVLGEAPDLALDLTRRALPWEPNNPFLWNLWGRSLAALGRIALAEAVFWEATRRFPDNSPSHVELGRLLAGLARTDEALAILRETVRCFPDDGPSHVELARVLAATGDLEGAIDVLRMHVRHHRDNPIPLNVLGLLLVNANRVEEARPILERLDEIGGERQVSELSSAIARADAGQETPFPPYHYPIGASSKGAVEEHDEFCELCLDGVVTRADFDLSPTVRPQLSQERQQQVLQELQDLMRDNVDHGYARVVWFDRAGASEEATKGLLKDFPRLFELRLIAALRWSDVGELHSLEQEHPEQGLLVRLARISIGASDAEDRARVSRWFQRDAPPADDLVGGYLHRAVRAHFEREGVDPSVAGPGVLAEQADALGRVLRQAVRMIGTLPVAA